MDNCARENKNKYVMAYLSYLIKCNIFDNIEMNFLPVGHTHIDIDAMFGNFHTLFKNKNVFTIYQYHEILKDYFKDKLKLIQNIDRLPNITLFLKLNNYLNSMIGKYFIH